MARFAKTHILSLVTFPILTLPTPLLGLGSLWRIRRTLGVEEENPFQKVKSRFPILLTLYSIGRSSFSATFPSPPHFWTLILSTFILDCAYPSASYLSQAIKILRPTPNSGSSMKWF